MFGQMDDSSALTFAQSLFDTGRWKKAKFSVPGVSETEAVSSYCTIGQVALQDYN